MNVKVNTMPGLIVNKTGLQVLNLFREPEGIESGFFIGVKVRLA